MSSSSSKNTKKPASKTSSSSTPTPKLECADFTTKKCTEKSYEKFLSDVFTIINHGLHVGIPFLPTMKHDDIKNHFFVKLSNEDGHVIKLIVRKSDLYIVGYQGDVSGVWFFTDTERKVMEGIFTDVPPSSIKPFNFQATYKNLQGKANAVYGRSEFYLNVNGFANSITELSYMKTIDNKAVGKAFLIFVQTISEALRLKEFRAEVARIFEPKIAHKIYTYSSEYKPTAYDLSCQNQWGSISEKVWEKQMSTDKFDKVKLEGAPDVESVEEAAKIIHILNSRRSS